MQDSVQLQLLSNPNTASSWLPENLRLPCKKLVALSTGISICRKEAQKYQHMMNARNWPTQLTASAFNALAHGGMVRMS